jgi:predicted Zn finger-like uncharacterized protein
MIVICTKCEAKFRVADERVGPRGANVRCSRCREVFFVQPAAGAAPAAGAPAAAPAVPGGLAVDLERGASPSLENPFAVDPVRAPSGARPPPLPPPLPTRVSPGPADPFAAFAASAPSADPFAAGAPAPPDPFAAGAPPAGPFAPARAPAAEIPEADPADLLAVAAGGGDPDPASASLALEGTTGNGLALEDRQTPHPVPAAPRGGGADAFPAGGGYGADPAAYDSGGFGEDESPALASEPAVAGAEPVAPPPATAPPEEARPPTRAPAPAPEPDARIPGARGSRLRAAVVNAIALAALLAAALAILVVWRTEGHLDATSLRPAAIVAGLRRAGAPGPFSPRDVRSGLYEREKGPPVLFVRGEVVSRAPAPVAGVKVAVEIVRDGRVIARGEALAGAVPTPEALHRAADAAALAAVAREAASRAPSRVAPGDAVPFLVAIADHPADLEGASLRVEVAAAGAAP